jgi:rubrerythrin
MGKVTTYIPIRNREDLKRAINLASADEIGAQDLYQHLLNSGHLTEDEEKIIRHIQKEEQNHEGLLKRLAFDPEAIGPEYSEVFMRGLHGKTDDNEKVDN